MPGARCGCMLFLLPIRKGRFFMKVRLRDGFTICGDGVLTSAGSSSSGSFDWARIRNTSDALWIVVEQLIWPPRKNSSLPCSSNNGVV